jgi:hypothetical protein
MKTRILAVSLVLAASGAFGAETAGFAAWLETVHKADKNADGMLTPSEVMYYNPADHEIGFRPFMVDHFAAWDFNDDGMVSMEEIDAGRKKAAMSDDDMTKSFQSVGFQLPKSN